MDVDMGNFIKKAVCDDGNPHDTCIRATTIMIMFMTPMGDSDAANGNDY